MSMWRHAGFLPKTAPQHPPLPAAGLGTGLDPARKSTPMVSPYWVGHVRVYYHHAKKLRPPALAPQIALQRTAPPVDRREGKREVWR